MPFKVKDLMVDVTSATGAAATGAHLQCYPTYICHWGCTYYGYSGCHFYCTHVHFSGCGLTLVVECQNASIPMVQCPGSLVTDTTPIIQTTPQFSGPSLVNLKEQLKQALAAAEKQTVIESETLKPQTLADVEMLEKKMGEALEELRARKAELNKKK